MHLWLRVTTSGLIAVAGLAFQPSAGRCAEPPRPTWKVDINGSSLEGATLLTTARETYFLGRDGRLSIFNGDFAGSARQTAPLFHGYTVTEMRAQLVREFGKAFEVSATNHYLVVHPAGQRDQWAARFEDLYRSLVHYFSRRSIPVREPEFPLVAIVWPTQRDFLRYAAQDGAPVSNQVLGYYSPRTNRIALFDAYSDPSGLGGQQNLDTIIHEATHQTAYNTGLHRRFAAAPRWLVEGLATMFEARGVWNSRDYPNQNDRLNRGRLEQFRRLPSARGKGSLAELIAHDRVFDHEVDRAYAQAWALTFFLVETQSQRYNEYLQLTARRAAFSEYPAAERQKDFVRAFGETSMLEAHFLRFVDGLK